MKEVYLVRHSAPFVNIKADENVKWSDFNRNMILDDEGEENALSLLLLGELKKVDKVYSADSARAIATIKYVAKNSEVEVEVDKELNEREIGVEYKKDIPDDFLKKQFEDETIHEGYVGNPHVFELVFDEDKVTSVKSIYNNAVYKTEDEEDEDKAEELIEEIDKG